MSKDYFEQDILDDALSERQKERKQARAPKLKKKELEAEKAEASEQNKKKRRKFFFIVVIVLAIIVALFGKSFWQIYELKKEKAEAEAKLDGINDDIGRLEEELKRVSDPEYIMQEARNRLRMILPGEKLYVVRKSEDSNGK